MNELLQLEFVFFHLAVTTTAVVYARRCFNKMRQAQIDLEREAQSVFLAEKVGGVGTWAVDAEHRKVYWSDQVFLIHGRDLGDGEPPFEGAVDYYHPNDRARVLAMMERAFERGSSFEFKATLVAEDGTHKTVLARGTCQRNYDGEVSHVFGVFIEENHVIEIENFDNDNLKFAS